MVSLNEPYFYNNNKISIQTLLHQQQQKLNSFTKQKRVWLNNTQGVVHKLRHALGGGIL